MIFYAVPIFVMPNISNNYEEFPLFIKKDLPAILQYVLLFFYCLVNMTWNSFHLYYSLTTAILSHLYMDILIFVFLRKISPELTAASPPLFAEEDWPWANIRAYLSLLYMWDAYHSMACQTVPCLPPGFEPANPGPLRSGTCELNCCATGPAPESSAHPSLITWWSETFNNSLSNTRYTQSIVSCWVTQ